MREINPQETTRASAFEMWMSSPMPMVTLTKTFNITHICKISKKSGLKLNMLLCWCICKAASRFGQNLPPAESIHPENLSPFNVCTQKCRRQRK